MQPNMSANDPKRTWRTLSAQSAERSLQSASLLQLCHHRDLRTMLYYSAEV